MKDRDLTAKLRERISDWQATFDAGEPATPARERVHSATEDSSTTTGSASSQPSRCQSTSAEPIQLLREPYDVAPLQEFAASTTAFGSCVARDGHTISSDQAQGRGVPKAHVVAEPAPIAVDAQPRIVADLTIIGDPEPGAATSPHVTALVPGPSAGAGTRSVFPPADDSTSDGPFWGYTRDTTRTAARPGAHKHEPDRRFEYARRTNVVLSVCVVLLISLVCSLFAFLLIK